MLTREQLIEMASPREVVMNVQGFPGPVKVRLFRKRELDEIRAEALVAGELNNEKFERLLVMRGVIEPAMDEELFTIINDGGAGCYYQLISAIMEGNGLTALAQRETRRMFPPDSR